MKRQIIGLAPKNGTSMDRSYVLANIRKLPFTLDENLAILESLIRRNGSRNILELGVGYGKATCFMAALLQERGEGKVTAVDLEQAREWFSPSAEETLANYALSTFVEMHRTKTGYPWFLRSELRRKEIDPEFEPYDLCIIDGPKNWTIDGLAFLLVSRLLAQGGWIIFDDYLWTYQAANSRREQTDGIVHRELSEDEINTPHIKEVFDLLVCQSDDFECQFTTSSGWALARKKGGLSFVAPIFGAT